MRKLSKVYKDLGLIPTSGKDGKGKWEFLSHANLSANLWKNISLNQKLGFSGGSVVFFKKKKKASPSAKQEKWVRSLDWESSLEKEMAINSSILAWEIPQTENSGRLQSMGSLRAGHNLETKQQFLSYRIISLGSWLTDKKLIFLTQSWYRCFSSVAVNVRITKYTPTVPWHSRKLSRPDSDN